MTLAVVLLCNGLIGAALVALVVRSTRRTERDYQDLRRWRHDVATPCFMRHEVELGRLQDKVGIRPIDEAKVIYSPPMERRPPS
jgi:hypothetical protein